MTATVKKHGRIPFLMDPLLIEDPVYGKKELRNETVLAIIKTPEFQRLKGINQYGTGNYMTPKMPTTRYEHSIGVYLLLQKLGASFEEQIAGLLHDISHTAFSHVVDFLRNESMKQDFHELHLKRVLESSEIKEILGKEGFRIDRITDHSGYSLLDSDDQSLNADRLDYGMRDGLLFGTFRKDRIDKVLGSLLVKDGQIVLADEESASAAAWSYFHTSTQFWSNPLFGGSYMALVAALRAALDKGIIREEDLFGTDEEVMGKLKASEDARIMHYLGFIDWVNLSEQEHGEFMIKTKARYIDPLFWKKGKLIRYSEADEVFKERVEAWVREMKNGHRVGINTKL